MGSNGSAHQQCPSSNGLAHRAEIGRGWTQSFPRELTRHHSQPTGHKVLPEPPNQRLRATNNGSIIHNGGTISGRRPSALTLPHDLNKQGVFRSRSTSASNFGAPYSRRDDRHCCRYEGRGECHSMENEMQELKRFGSEPDLRYSPVERNGRQQQHGQDHRQTNGYYPERDSRERESRYKNKKKYKAPAPPTNGCADGSSPESYKWDVGHENRCRAEEEVQPPPRRSRLFKTRAETKKAQVNWMSTLSNSAQQDRPQDNSENERRWRHDRSKEGNVGGWRDQDYRLSRDGNRKSKILDGKNTLQRSMSSPEFQAELMQVARKVRNKLNGDKRCSTPVTMESPLKEQLREQKRPEKRNSRSQEVSFEERRADNRVVSRVHEERRVVVDRVENKTTSYEERREEYARDSNRRKEYVDGRHLENGSGGKRRLLEKSSSACNGEPEVREITRKPLKEKMDALAREFSEDRHRSADPVRNRKSEESQVTGRTRSESPIKRSNREKMDLRGQGSGRESTPEPNELKVRDKENSDPRCWRRNELRDQKNDKRRSESTNLPEKKDLKPKDKNVQENREPHDNWHILPEPEKTTPKTFYFGMEEGMLKETQNSVEQHMEQIQSRLEAREIDGMPENPSENDDSKNGIEDISLKLRPTLPKKQLEIPRFSPSVAWRLLSALEAPGPTMSTASEEIPVFFEERIERLSRPPPALIALGPRSSNDKSGDSGISGDAGAGNDDSLDVSTTNRVKTAGNRPTWTPQQDLGEESSSDAGVDSPPPMPVSVKFPPRAHVFSLSLPRDDNRMYIYNPELKGKENSTFNSLQKLRRSVSGALGLGALEIERKPTGDVLDDNWLLSTSAPTSLQHNQITEAPRSSPTAWKPTFNGANEAEDDEEEDIEDRTDFPVIMKPPSFSYLASGGHVMYLPESNGTQYQPQSLNYRSGSSVENEKSSNNSIPKYKKNGSDDTKKSTKSSGNDNKKNHKQLKNLAIFRERSFVNESNLKTQKFTHCSKSCENISEMKQRTNSPTPSDQNVQESKETSSEIKALPKSSSKGRRFTFQSTVRQIERRRLAEKLSREAEAKERQRKGELEAMRKVEEEFQRKRAREKANIRQQLRLYSMDENLSSLPSAWDSSQLSRADPDGAPSSSASSPTSAPPGKLAASRKNSVSSDEYHKKRLTNTDSRKQQQQQQQQREYKDYRPKYYDWAPETSSHIEYKQTTIHPKVICDIPKSSPVFVDANVHGNKAANLSCTPRSDNYRKDFAHGAVAAKSSLASSDSELSQPNTRPHSRQTGVKGKPLRSRSASPERSVEAASSDDENPVMPVKQERNANTGFILNGVQPFVREKNYRPISFNPHPPPPIPS